MQSGQIFKFWGERAGWHLQIWTKWAYNYYLIQTDNLQNICELPIKKSSGEFSHGDILEMPRRIYFRQTDWPKQNRATNESSLALECWLYWHELYHTLGFHSFPFFFLHLYWRAASPNDGCCSWLCPEPNSASESLLAATSQVDYWVPSLPKSRNMKVSCLAAFLFQS